MFKFLKKNKTIYDIEKELVIAKSRYDTYYKTFSMQAGFTENNREKLIEYKTKVDLLQFELNKYKFKEVINGNNDDKSK